MAQSALHNGRRFGNKIFVGMEQFHLHWSHDLNSTEHTVDGQFYDAELHLVHAKEGFETFAEALQHSDGLAVLGIFLQLQNGTTLTPLNALESELGKVVDADASVQIQAYNIAAHLPINADKYFRYNGSLTTPTCNEVVVWTVFAQPSPITAAQLNLLEAIRGSNGQLLTTNVRPVQPFNKQK